MMTKMKMMMRIVRESDSSEDSISMKVVSGEGTDVIPRDQMTPAQRRLKWVKKVVPSKKPPQSKPAATTKEVPKD